jgi:O-antigen/teichoic acid export membrane protein
MNSHNRGAGQKLIANAMFNALGQAFAIVLAFVATPYLVHHLGEELYGLIALVGTIAGFAGLLNLGIGTALAKFVSELYWKRDFQRIGELFQSALGVVLVGGGAACALLIVYRRDLAAAFIHASSRAAQFVTFALFVAAFGVLLSLASRPFGAILMGVQRFDLTNLLSVSNAAVWYVGAMIVLALGFSARAVLIVDLAGSVGLLAVSVILARRLIPGLHLRPRLRVADLRYLFGFSAYVILTAVSSLLVHRFDSVLVAYFLPISAVTFYVVPYALAQKTWKGVGVVTSVILPTASELSAMREHSKLQELYLRATRVVLIAAAPVTLVLLAAPGPVLRYWIGKDFALHSALVMRLLAAGFFVNILAHVPYVVAQGIGRPQIATKNSVLNAVVNVTLFVVLIPRFGIVGAASGFLASEIIVMPLLICEVNRLVHVRWLTLISKAYLRPLACGAAAFAALWLVRGYIDSLAKLLIAAALAVGLYGVLAFVGALDYKERSGVCNEAARFFRHARSLASV